MTSHRTDDAARRLAADRLIVALDVDSTDLAQDIVDDLGELVSFYKVGMELFFSVGRGFIEELLRQEKRIFLDLKIDDVDETIQRAVTALSSIGIEFLTIHGNGATARAAHLGRDRAVQAGRGSPGKPKLLQVTALSSLDQQDIQDLLNDGNATLSNVVLKRAAKAHEAGCDGVIASGDTVKLIREHFSDDQLLIVTPGIRPAGSANHEHKRSQTPHQAISNGANYLVVGRPIRDADDRREAARAIIDEIGGALADKDNHLAKAAVM